MRISLRSGVRGFRAALVVAVLIAVLTVLIAPSIDMPETVLREHHVAAHSMVNTSSGTLMVVGIVSLSEAFHDDTFHVIESSRNLEHGHSQTSLVLRC